MMISADYNSLIYKCILYYHTILLASTIYITYSTFLLCLLSSFASLCYLINDIQKICTLNLASIGRPKIISPRFLFGLPTITEKHLYFIIIYLLLSD